jgi:protein-L-isoaspartate(D-aspartate) O-methyltransferase
MVALMLTQLDLRPGHRVLEIGAGTGYNAALLAEMVGPTGHVTTIDLDPGVALHARNCLDQAGYPRVTVMERDGLMGAPEHGPNDRIIATVGMWDLPRSWWSQLSPTGRIVMPFRWRGQTRTMALNRVNGASTDHLVAESSELCGFIPFVGQDGEQVTSLLADTIRIHHDRDQSVDQDLLADVFTHNPVEVWTDIQVGYGEPFDGIWLQAAACDDRVCRIEVTPEAAAPNVRTPIIPVRSPALVKGSSIAYLIGADNNTLLGAAGYGPCAAEVADDLVRHIRTWSANRTSIPVTTLFPLNRGSDVHIGRHSRHHILKADSVMAFG